MQFYCRAPTIDFICQKLVQDIRIAHGNQTEISWSRIRRNSSRHGGRQSNDYHINLFVFLSSRFCSFRVYGEAQRRKQQLAIKSEILSNSRHRNNKNESCRSLRLPKKKTRKLSLLQQAMGEVIDTCDLDYS